MGILILEDDSRILDLLKEEINRNLGPQLIFEASDPIEALTIFEKNKFKINCIVCDYLLPIQNGKDFVEIVKEHSPHVKVCIYTGDVGVTEKIVPKVNEVFYKYNGTSQVIKFIRGNT